MLCVLQRAVQGYSHVAMVVALHQIFSVMESMTAAITAMKLLAVSYSVMTLLSSE